MSGEKVWITLRFNGLLNSGNMSSYVEDAAEALAGGGTAGQYYLSRIPGCPLGL